VRAPFVEGETMAGLFSVEGKNVLVTGGSRGIGLMIAGGFVAAGAHVWISSRKASACAEAAATLNAAGPGTCAALPADLSDPANVPALVEALTGAVDRLDVLVNNAGAVWGAPLAEYPDSAFDKLWAINVKAVFRLTVALLPLLRAAATPEDPARVINVGSIDGIKVPALPVFAYAPTKAAVHMVTRQLAHELAPEHITVNAVAPGPFPSKMMAFALDNPAVRAEIEKSVPLGRIGTPEDVAGTAIYLASRAGAYLTGAIIPVDGGLTTHG
jgi:NAD(P)-dependent dehydrogenase (short-subunit alcohol dehydrogenase family)